MHQNMANKILFIGVGSAGSKVVDKAMKDYPELFESVAIDCGTNRNLSCYQLNMMSTHPYDENPGFTTIKENEIKYIYDRYKNDSLDDIDLICHTIEKWL